MALLFGGMAAWFLRYRYDRKEPSIWFFIWLVAASATNAFGALSWWVDDFSISGDLWIASAVCLSASIFLIFGFARSFSVEAKYTLLFWSVPFMLNAAVIIVGSHAIYERSGSSWIPQGYGGTALVHVALDSFYALLILYYVIVLYLELRTHAQRQELINFRYILGGLAIMFLSVSIGGWLRATVNPEIPVPEIGTIVGALLIMRGVVGPVAGFAARKAQGEA